MINHNPNLNLDSSSSSSSNSNSNSNLKNLSDQDLLSETKLAVFDERNQTSKVLNYLREVERRRLYLERSHASMFVFCMKELGYDEAQTQRRLSAMRLMCEMPEIEPKIASGELSKKHACRG